MPNIYDRTRRILNKRQEKDNRAERAARHDRQERLFKERQREHEQQQYR